MNPESLINTEFANGYYFKKILYYENFKYHIIVEALIENKDSGDVIETYFAYNHNGDFIGDPEISGELDSYGILPEKSNDEHKVCSIGFSSKFLKWYGWSHRAIYGFEPGYEIPNDCVVKCFPEGYIIKNWSEAREAAIDFARNIS